MTPGTLQAITKRFQALDRLNDAENPDDDPAAFTKALQVRAWACAWDVEELLEEVGRQARHISDLELAHATVTIALGHSSALAETLQAQRDKALAYVAGLPCTNCEHVHNEPDGGLCGHSLEAGVDRWYCHCDWGNQITDDIRDIFAGKEISR